MHFLGELLKFYILSIIIIKGKTSDRIFILFSSLTQTEGSLSNINLAVNVKKIMFFALVFMSSLKKIKKNNKHVSILLHLCCCKLQQFNRIIGFCPFLYTYLATTAFISVLVWSGLAQTLY